MSAIPSALELPGGAHVLFTDRSHGNLSSVGGEQAELGAQAREQLRELIGVQRLARGFQVHGTTVRLVGDLSSPELDVPADRADGQATVLRGVATMVLSADCLPVALGCGGAVAMVHAGWRGLAAGVLEQGVLALQELSDGREEITAVIGPGAGPCCYEVGEEVHAAFAGRHRHGQNIDLRAIARERLLAAGVAEVCDGEACTICDERFFSHRREGERAGRQGGVAWLS
jgi:polyphenol oxidase